MRELTLLYTSKDNDNCQKIEQLQSQLEDMKVEKWKDRELLSKTFADNNNLKTSLDRYRRQGECLATDLHRMNEELYQHWLGLKDIKTLAERLQLMPKFIRIYQDMRFDDQLFS